MKIGIVGATGYGGAELVRILTHHPHAEECILYSSSGEGKVYSNVYPHLTGLAEQKLKPIDMNTIKQEIDVMFLAAPPGVSSELTPQLAEVGISVIDLSGDLRIQEPAVYEKWYKRTAAPKETIQEAVYGLSELNQRNIQQAKLIANPGCFPTAVLLGLAPLAQKKLLDESFVIVDAKTGVSGAGRKASMGTHFSELNDNFKIYKVNEHQHTPEIEQTLKEWQPELKAITFSAHLVPMTRGIMATMYTQLTSDLSAEDLHDLYSEFYQDSYFVRVRPKGHYPQTKEVFGSNFCDVSVTLDERTNRVTIVSVIDNLMKGAAGQAVQNFNIMNGWNEETGLTMTPIYP
ncbi:N-acetyl-gamma-glutamyl-phosphate reductase [Bacillus sp. FSL K6-1012]|uniref:N-acetyl-gamma-glutamyl-phosphate reductase n=1 Tax=Bacillus TaxID=1386 RepID=UPI0018DE5914|nr:N-acetyl-gamma-glutamyl-phosphate reductase [Bacillus halotolerans]MBU5246352.1 N-acetyl-gamma-glutamyl-phosphate reductase [Bacillus halotolerans]MCM3352496.1 N-acetyl-gamma-glutamyl-phosphate reductase [Bacillus halotolerans]QPZ40854.1 N-acetyl-gamma-glutamyl-phosphate reductase [Bacillus halotolerans]QVN28760.1 N-acetyl-gamma-glutamyl-phosphate reductase [Bacillus halotolerans]